MVCTFWSTSLQNLATHCRGDIRGATHAQLHKLCDVSDIHGLESAHTSVEHREERQEFREAGKTLYMHVSSIFSMT